MEREPVIANLLSEVSYNEACRTLEILFKSGAIYLYYFVSTEVHRDLMNATCHDTYFAQNIKHDYESRRIAEPAVPKRRRSK